MKQKIFRTSLLLWLPFLAFLAIFFWLLNARYPSLGHDFRLFFPFLLEGRWHFWHMGLWPLRYAPHLCAGFPLYGNPNDLFYSLTQFFAFFLYPWTSVQLSVGITMIAGYAGWLLCGRDVLKLTAGWSHVLALTIAASGFYFMHIMVGHMNFLPFPLLGYLFWLLFDRREKSMHPLLRIALFAVISGIMLYAGGYYVLAYFGLMCALVVPLDILLWQKNKMQRAYTLFMRMLPCAVASGLLGFSKITAVQSLLSAMGYNSGMSAFERSTNTFWYIAKTFWAIPQSKELFEGIPWALHEQSLSLSPVVLIGLCAGIIGLFLRRKKSDRRLPRILACAYLIIVLLLFVQLVRGYGVIADALYNMPVFSSFRVPTRILYPLSLLLSAAGIVSLAALTTRYFHAKESWIIAGAMVITLGAFAGAYVPLIPEYELFLDYHRFKERTIGDIDRAMSLRVFTLVDADYDFNGKTTMKCNFETVFIAAGNPQARNLHTGPVTDIRNGSFNMANPSCYQYGTENNCAPGDPIAVEDRVNFERFRSGQSVTWKTSTLQRMADGISLLTFIVCIGVIVRHAGKRWMKRNTKQKN